MSDTQNATPTILILSGVQGDTRRYRTHHLYEQFKLAGVNCRLGHITDRDIIQQAERADCLIVHRITWDRFTEKLFEQASRRGTLILLDVDDLTFDSQVFEFIDSPDFADATRARLYRDNMQRAREVLDRCAAVLASTGFLAERAQACGKPAWVHRNAFSLEMMSLSSAAVQQRTDKAEKIIIGYASGTRTHDQDFALARPAIQRVLHRHPNCHLWLAGHLDPGSGWTGLEDRIQLFSFRPWRQLPDLLARFSINLAPLRSTNPFGQSKSEIKYMEAGLVGTPTIASPTEAFTYAIRLGENGLLAMDEAAWEEALESLIVSSSLRNYIADGAKQDAYNCYAPWVRAGEAIHTLEEIAQRFTGHGMGLPKQTTIPIVESDARKDLWLSLEFEKHPTLFERGLHTLRSRGTATLLQEVWVYLRRFAAPVFPFRSDR